MTPRSFLYVPADRDDRLAKAHTRGADAIIADLEDAVAPGDKDAALASVEAWLSTRSVSREPGLWVRVNAGERGRAEAATLARFTRLTGVLVPKVESASHVWDLRQALGSAARRVLVAPMIESAAALVRVDEIASAPGVHQLHVGEVDLAADLGITPGESDAEFSYARSRIVVASRAAGIAPPVAPVNTRTDDPSAFSSSTTALARMGFVGRDCIHPVQVAVANDVFGLNHDDIERAKQLLKLAEGERGSFRGPDGSMIDEAVLRRARDLVALDLNLDRGPADH